MLRTWDRSKWDQILGERLRSWTGLPPATRSTNQLKPALRRSRVADPTTRRTGRIVRLYDLLLAVKPSPVVALNRAIALAEVHGPQAAIDAVAGIPQQGALDSYPFFAATLGELHARLGKTNAAAEYLQRAIALTSSPADRRYLQGRLDACRALQD
jgi:RNA polymerase sigma-70 factor (ECF subfamily)